MDKRYTSLKNRSLSKRIPLSITHDEYLNIVKDNECHYCRSSLPNVGYGLDRKYSNLGYSLDNCVPCCATCNTEKGVMDYEEYIELWGRRRLKRNTKLNVYLSVFSEFDCIVQRDYLLFDKWLKVYIKSLKERPILASSTSIAFYEDEIANKLPIVKSIINNKLNKTTKIFARKCEIGKPSIDETKNFLDNNHLKGYHNASGYGLYYNNELVFIVTIKIFSEEIELYRVATKLNHVVIGGLSRIISKIENTYDMNTYSMISYVDRRYHTGDGYLKSGFKCVSCSNGYFYTDGIKRYNRLMGKAQNGLTEIEYTESLGWTRIDDVGQAKFVKSASLGGYENIQKFCILNNLELLTSKEEYVGSGRHKYVFIKPTCGHVFKRGRSKLYNSHACPICKGTGNSRVYDRINFIAEKYRLIISNKEEIKSKNSIVKGKCYNGHDFAREYRYIRDVGCPVCNGLNGYSKSTLGGSSADRKNAVYQNIIEHCKKTNQKCITTLHEFMLATGPSAHITLKIECENYHIRETSWYTLKCYGCSVCSKNSIKQRFAEKPITSYASKEDYQVKQRMSTYQIIENYVNSIGGKTLTTFEEFNILCKTKNIKNSAIKVMYLLDGKELGIRRGKIKTK